MPNLGNYFRYSNVVRRVRKRKRIDVLALGGSITAGGYFMEFVRTLKEKENLTVSVHNHGHGATEITCTQMDVPLLEYDVRCYLSVAFITVACHLTSEPMYE